MPTSPDFSVTFHGNICILNPLTEQAKDWVSENVIVMQRYAGGIVVESRFIDNVVAGFQNDGLTVATH